MGFLATEGGSYELKPQGPNPGVLNRLIDLGHQPPFQGRGASRHQIQLGWALPLLPPVETAEGPIYQAISRIFTLSLDPRSNLRQFLDGVLGAGRYDTSQGFEVSRLLRMPMLLNIIHEANAQGQWRDKVAAAMPYQGQPLPDVPVTVFNLSEPNWDVFRSLSERTQQMIAQSPEYAERQGLPTGVIPPQAASSYPTQAGMPAHAPAGAYGQHQPGPAGPANGRRPTWGPPGQPGPPPPPSGPPPQPGPPPAQSGPRYDYGPQYNQAAGPGARGGQAPQASIGGGPPPAAPAWGPNVPQHSPEPLPHERGDWRDYDPAAGGQPVPPAGATPTAGEQALGPQDPEPPPPDDGDAPVNPAEGYDDEIPF